MHVPLRIPRIVVPTSKRNMQSLDGCLVLSSTHLIRTLKMTTLNILGTGLSVASILTSFVVLLAIYLACDAVYSLTLHPLASFPGSTFAAVSRIPWLYVSVTGTQVPWIQNLHTKYGPVLRFSPNEISYIDTDGRTWQEINGHGKHVVENMKAIEYSIRPTNGSKTDLDGGVPSMIIAGYEDHRRMRHTFAPAFSDRALKAQEPMFHKHVDIMLAKTRDLVMRGDPIDMNVMLNCATYDIMGDLTFGKSLGLLESIEYSHWLKTIMDSLKVIPIFQTIEAYPVLNLLYTCLRPSWIVKMQEDHFKYTSDLVDSRLANGSTQPDIWNLVLNAEGSEALTLGEMHSCAELFMIAGSETTATLLAGVIYYLLRNPSTLNRVVDEIRTSFANTESFTFERLGGLRYLNACLQEALRVYPPLPIGVARVVPPGGSPPLNFRDPDAFVPERWLDEHPAYRDDNRECLQPFSVGSRNCIGQNMARHEMRLILAKLLFAFDLKLCAESSDWVSQK
ncbi:hypothetical protein PG984_015742, partial [Apiospora sp. TS-2023a]